MSDDALGASDVFWGPNPYDGRSTEPRPWLVLATDSLPFGDEELLCAALTTSDILGNLRVGDDWLAGGVPDVESYCSPRVLGTIKRDAVVNPQGAVTSKFTESVVRESVHYLETDLDVDTLDD
ncbi:MAG: hypothetical protein ABEI99_07880 [Halobaculum sp.]